MYDNWLHNLERIQRDYKKVLREIRGKKMIEHIIDVEKFQIWIKPVYSIEQDKILLDIAREKGIFSYAGSRESVIDRMLDVAKKEKATNLVRITGDNIFTDRVFLEEMIKLHTKNKVDYTRTEYLPLGVTAEVINVSALQRCYEEMDPNESEYLSFFMFNPNKYSTLVLMPPKKLRKEFSTLSVDTFEDLERTKYIFDSLGEEVYYDDIILLNQKEKIPYFEVPKNLKLKLPKNRFVTFEEYRMLSEEKINKSNTIILEENFYEKNR